MRVERLEAARLNEALELRRALWPDLPAEEHHRFLVEVISSAGGEAAAVIARDSSGGAIGYAQASLRRDYVNGCETSPVVFLEELYVAPAHRRRGAAKALCAELEVWARDQGCSEFGSDALLENLESHAFHRAIGFEERERVVFFRKQIR